MVLASLTSATGVRDQDQLGDQLRAADAGGVRQRQGGHGQHTDHHAGDREQRGDREAREEQRLCLSCSHWLQRAKQYSGLH